MDKICGIYTITSKVCPEKVYVGNSGNVKYRWTGHLRLLKQNMHNNKKLQYHCNKYGIDDFLFSIIEETDHDRGILLQREQYYIDTINPWFNICMIAGSRMGTVPWNKGVPCTEEAKRKISEMGKGRPSPLKGKKFTAEHAQKIAAKSLGRLHTPEAKLKMSISQTGVKHTKERIENNRKANLGKKRSEQAKQNISNSLIGHIVTQATKDNIKNAMGRLVIVYDLINHKRCYAPKGLREFVMPIR